MLETVAIFIGMAIAKKALDRVGEHTGDAFVASLHKLGDWVREKVMSRPTGQVAIEMMASAPEGEAGDERWVAGRKMLTSVLTEITANDPEATSELQSLVAELKQHAPPDVVYDGDIVVDNARGGRVTGLKVKGSPSGGIKAGGRINVGTATDTEITGADIQFGP
jgi:hypothetical protein